MEEQPHVIFLPFPLQGHVKPMLTLAKLLSLAGIHITFVNSDRNHHRLLHHTEIQLHALQNPHFHFASIPDGLSPDHPQVGLTAADLFFSSASVMKSEFRKLLSRQLSIGKGRRPTCVIADGVMSFAMDIAEELGIPFMMYRTYSACSTWVFLHLDKLIEEGEVPVQDENMERPVTCIPGLENILRCRDLPNICRLEPENNVAQVFINENKMIMARTPALILDTFEDLESPIISRLASVFPGVYTVGPLHALLRSRAAASPSSIHFGTSLRKEDRSCISWLDSQPSQSVVYISFGSLIVISYDQLIEFWHGLVNSCKPFLWVIRPDQIEGHSGPDMGQVPKELRQATEDRGLIVDWAPQEDVLAHSSVGGFLMHSGWNSTLESIQVGVPMIGWPLFADQQVNSRCVSELWKIGFNIKEVDRFTVEKTVRALMEDRRAEIMESMAPIRVKANESVKEGGSSWQNLDRLIQDIRYMSIS